MAEVLLSRLIYLGRPSPGPWRLKAINFNAISFQRFSVDTSEGEITAMMPSAPVDGDEIEFQDYAGTWEENNFIIDGNGFLFEEEFDRLLCNFPTKVTVVFGNNAWRLRS